MSMVKKIKTNIFLYFILSELYSLKKKKLNIPPTLQKKPPNGGIKVAKNQTISAFSARPQGFAGGKR